MLPHPPSSLPSSLTQFLATSSRHATGLQKPLQVLMDQISQTQQASSRMRRSRLVSARAKKRQPKKLRSENDKEQQLQNKGKALPETGRRRRRKKKSQDCLDVTDPNSSNLIQDTNNMSSSQKDDSELRACLSYPICRIYREEICRLRRGRGRHGAFRVVVCFHTERRESI